MARYIDVEPLEDKLKEHIRKTESELMLGALSTFLRVLDITPTADVEPIKHGRWESYSIEPEAYDIAGVKSWAKKYRCSECRFLHIVIEDFGIYTFCPNCGARMDGDDDEID